MKKVILTISFSILLITGLLIIIVSKNMKIYTNIGGVKYAIVVDGESSNSFPNGNYKVDISCTNADAYWDSIDNKVIIKNIKGSVVCDIDFNSITNVDYLNAYITNLSGTTQGEGKLIQEFGETVDYTNTSRVKSYGTTPVYFRNTLYYGIGQTQVDNFWTLDSSTGVFTSNPSKMTTTGSSAYYHVYAQVPSSGYYQICYTIDQSPNENNRLFISKNTSTITYVDSSTSAQVNETCYNIGYFSDSDYINVVEKGYSGTSSPVMTFYLEKAGIVPVDTGYRYEGANPNNFVIFNNELWKIIGVFSTEYDANNDGTIDKSNNLVKIIRDETVGVLTWNKSNINDWPNSSLYHLLNEQYYDWENYKNSVSLYCYGYSTTVPAKCDYSIKGIQDGYRSMVLKTKWYLGGGGNSLYNTYTSDSVYNYERDSNAINNGRSASTLGYIGLMYESDYLYGVLESDCARTTIHSEYANNNCAGQDWLNGGGYEWTITPNSAYSNYVWSLNTSGVGEYYANYGSNVRPTLYLSPDVYRVSGTGTITDPYIIGMAQ